MADPFEQAVTVEQLREQIEGLPADAVVAYTTAGFFEFIGSLEMDTLYARDDFPVLRLHPAVIEDDEALPDCPKCGEDLTPGGACMRCGYRLPGAR